MSANGFVYRQYTTAPARRREARSIRDLEAAIIKTVAYVDGFDYPLTVEEIHRYLVGHSASLEQVACALSRRSMVPDRLRHIDGYYTLPRREATVDTRRRREAEAQILWPKAIEYGKMIARLPFVSMVAVTGSMAVDNVGEHVDVDYLIVTADDHLWVCRAMVIGIVRLAAKQGIVLCPNYFLAERALELADQNLYTAHEVAQMVPLSGFAVYEAFRQANRWTEAYLPNAVGAPSRPEVVQTGLPGAGPGAARRAAEALLRTSAGRGLERRVMDRKVRKFRRDEANWNEACFTPDCCKGHFNQHKRRALEAFDVRLARSTKV